MAHARSGTTITVTEDGEIRSSIACRVCRKRKTKCGRELPRCTLCEQSAQQCEYPCEVRRPGPKIGSIQAPRKRTASAGAASRPADKAPRLSVDRTSRAASPPPPPVHVVKPISPAPSLPSPSPSMQSLSFILHPSHDSCSPHHLPSDPQSNQNSDSHDDHVEAACLALGVQPCHVDDFIGIFSDTFTSFQLFRRQDFRRLLSRVPTATQTKALLAPVLAFAIRSCEDAVDDSALEATRLPPGCSSLSTSYLSSLARQYIDQAIAELEDDPLPLPLLQALILLTHWFLIKGVRGKAWRYLGTCVRSAYELNLHLVDVNNSTLATDAAAWCQDEERRRAWWAIWEMDAFASVIRRCPGGIDWSQNETFLPAEDENWARAEPQKSCRLDSSVTTRWKILADCGNDSPKAWFIVMNSLAKEAQCITTPIGLHKPGNRASRPTKEAVNRLVTLLNTVHCASSAIPAALKFRCQQLHFGTRSPDPASTAATRMQHASIYSIHCITQLARLMIYRYWIFHGAKILPRSQTCVPGVPGGDHRSPGPLGCTDNGVSSLEVSLALDQYLEAADEVYTLVRRSCADQHKHVNPYLANTLWLAGAVHLLYKRLASPSPTDRELISSNFMLLSVTYNNFLEHWQMSMTLQKNLEVVESELESLGSEQNSTSKDQNSALALLGRHHDGSSGTVQMNAERLAAGSVLAADCRYEGGQRSGGTDEYGFGCATVHNCHPNADNCFNQNLGAESGFVSFQPNEDLAGPSSCRTRNYADNANKRFPSKFGTSSNVGHMFPGDGDGQQGLLQLGQSIGSSNQGVICPDLFPLSPADADFTTYIDGMLSGSYMS